MDHFQKPYFKKPKPRVEYSENKMKGTLQMHQAKNEFSRIADVSRIPTTSMVMDITANASECKALAERFAIEPSKSLYLTKYIEDTPCEHQYVLVFVISHYTGELTPNPRKVEQVKWWTQPQIEANLNSGIFNSKFIREYSLLKRSGLLETETI